MTTIVLSLSLVLFISLFLYFFIKYNKEHKKYDALFSKTNQYISELNKPLRKGYYKTNCQQGSSIDYEAIIYVSEVDRYLNGDSKIRFNSVEIECGSGSINRNSAESFARKSFVTLVKTSDITWLESETEIKEQRRNKLEQLKEAMK